MCGQGVQKRGLTTGVIGGFLMPRVNARKPTGVLYKIRESFLASQGPKGIFLKVGNFLLEHNLIY